MSDSEHPEEPATEPAPGRFAAVRAQVDTWQARGTDWLRDHEHIAPIDIAVRLFRRDRDSAGTMVGSAIAFRLFLFFVPFLLFVVGTAGFISGWVDVEDVQDQTGVSGGLAAQVRSALQQHEGTRWIALFAGLWGMVTTGRTLSRVMAAASALSWQLPVSRKTSLRVVGSIAGLVVGIGLVSVIVNRIRAEYGITAGSVTFFGAFAAYWVAWFLITTLLPRATNDPSVLLPGATLVALTISVLQLVSQLYLPNRLSHASQLYGAIGTTIVTLGWFFLIGRAMVLANSLNAVVYERVGSIADFVFTLPVFRSIARRSAWIRKFFDLEPKP